MSPPNRSSITEWEEGGRRGTRTKKLEEVRKYINTKDTIYNHNSQQQHKRRKGQDREMRKRETETWLTTYRRNNRSTPEPPSRWWWSRAGVMRLPPTAPFTAFHLTFSTPLLQTRLQVHQNNSSWVQHSILCSRAKTAETAFGFSAGCSGRMDERWTQDGSLIKQK